MYELSSELAQKYKQTNRDPEDVAVIRLQPEQARVTNTETGTVITQPTTKLKLDEFGNESCLKAPVSEQQADTDAVQELKATLTDLRQDKADLKAEKTKFKRQRNEWRKDAKQRRGEIIDEFLSNSRKASDAFRPRDRRRNGQQDDADDLAPVPQTDLEQIDQEVAIDD